MAGEIKSKFGIESELEKLSGGIFDVYLDGELIFSKKSKGRFPEGDEVEQVIKSRLNK